MADFDFENQKLVIEGASYKVELLSGNEVSDICDNKIDIGGASGYGSDSLFIKSFDGVNNYAVLLVGIEQGFYLHGPSANDNGQSVKLAGRNLILSLGRTLVCLSWPDLKLNWKTLPDISCIFEFYDLEDDLLVRGELCIHRINMHGEIIWSYGGMDIWVNIDGKPEVTILENSIRLIDFASNEYLIDFDGKSLSFVKHERIQTLKSPWWKLWK